MFLHRANQAVCALFLLMSLCAGTVALGQTVDPMVKVGGYDLHFHIVKGTGTPILFESGGGDDAEVWRDILPPLAVITHTTLITYDREGFGKSGVDSRRHGIQNGVVDLEKGLKSLGYSGDIMLVAHSYGGWYATLYASRHTDEVKSAVLIDANLVCFYPPARLAATRKSNEERMAKLKNIRPGLYYQSLDFPQTVEVMRRTPFPSSIPAIDLVSEKTPFSNETDIQEWKRCHQEFADASANRRGVTAYGAGHYIFLANPSLVVNAIVNAYAETLSDEQRLPVLQRSLAYNLDAANDAKRREAEYSHSEDDMNSWGYQLMRQGEKQWALEVFKLNVAMHPQSYNPYDSLAECYEALGDRVQASNNYQRSLALNPKNTHATERLKELGD